MYANKYVYMLYTHTHTAEKYHRITHRKISESHYIRIILEAWRRRKNDTALVTPKKPNVYTAYPSSSWSEVS